MSANWHPALDKESLQARARLFSAVREFFKSRKVMEVDTPVLSRFASCDPNLHSLQSSIAKQHVFLHTSPEFFMKRLLAAGSGDIYSIARVFRDDEQGKLHNPEFLLLEWYRVNFDLESMARETVELLGQLLGLSLDQDFRLRTYSDVFKEHAGIDPLNASRKEMEQITGEIGLDTTTLDRDGLLDAIASMKVFPQLGKNCLDVVTEYPASQASLAEIDSANDAIAKRFEVFLHGIELANGFRELQDADEQATRFEADNEKRRKAGKAVMPIDQFLIDALVEGLPACAGVAVGLDRVFMLAQGNSSVENAMPFPFKRC
ncbi:MAG: EF-P lysine aminoacylase EpmA [Gammaproteobacteria bacterium]